MHFVLFLKIMFRTKIMPDPSSQETFFSTMGNTILHDDSTADFTIRCKTKVFRVHRNILCARSEVFRASIFTPMVEAATGEIFVEDLGENTLATLIRYLYTGELELGEDPDIVELARGGDKYLLPGFMDLLTLCLQLRKEEFPGKMIAHLLIAAHRHGAGDLRKIALDRVKENREIFRDPGFRKEMEEVTDKLTIILDVFKDLTDRSTL